MTTARDSMHVGAECIGEHETLQYAAQRMRDLDVGALPVCDDNEMLRGISTDRDIVTKCVASGADPVGMITDGYGYREIAGPKRAAARRGDGLRHPGAAMQRSRHKSGRPGQAGR